MDTIVKPQSVAAAPADVQAVLNKDEELMRLQNERISLLTKENEALKAKLPKVLEKRESTDAEIASGIAKMQAEADADLAKPNPRVTASTALSGFIGFIPVMTDEQKKAYYAAKTAIIVRYSTFHLARVGQVVKVINRVKDRKGSIVGTALKNRKDGTLSIGKVQVSEARKPVIAKPHAKDAAKPQQPAAKMPAAGNAANPAKL